MNVRDDLYVDRLFEAVFLIRHKPHCFRQSDTLCTSVVDHPFAVICLNHPDMPCFDQHAIC